MFVEAPGFFRGRISPRKFFQGTGRSALWFLFCINLTSKVNYLSNIN